MNFRVMNFRTFFFATCLINSFVAFPLSSASYQSIHKNDFRYTVRNIADNYLKSKSIDLYNMPTKIQTDYESSLTIAENLLIEICWSQGNLYISYNQIEKITKEEVDKFIRIATNVVLKPDINQKINDSICDLTHKNGLVKGDLKKHSEQEYESRLQKVKTKLNKIMADNYCSFVYIGEIDTAVYDEFTPLVKRIEQNKSSQNHSNASSAGSFWDWLFGTGTQPNASGKDSKPGSDASYKYNKYNDYDKIYSYEIDEKVLEISNQILVENSYNVETIPARVVSDYSDAIQKIIKQTKNKIGSDYSIYAYEIKDLAKKEIQAIIDKIKYKGEVCSICLDEIKSHQTLGVLNCGHFFHKNCIRTSLDYKNQCPLCGTHVNKIDHTETVPLQ